ncbi:MAG: F0F1 ATP synthase subunit B [Phycisphaeraceae bacterium]|nr:F0F1 ATP synthase subunit B [Phycisphaeraceae bacterium]MCW5753611.1 F0F1 ATP synthase subunit B [Phycisphaeraceae bacterium]
MKRCRLSLSVLVVSMLTATASAAADPAAEAQVVPPWQQGLMPLLVSLVVFAAAFAILSVKVWPVIVKALDERAKKIEAEIAAAEAARKQAKDALEEYERSLSQARAEAQKMLEETRAQQGRLAAELKAKADADLSMMRERAMKDIESAKRAALNEIYAETATLATHVATKVLGREVSAADQSRLVDESLRELSKVRSN